jgi:transposase InsO family protein
MDIDDDIADAAGLSAKGKGKQKERQVPQSRNSLLLTHPQCTERSTSVQKKEEPLGSDVDYESALLALVNSLNKIELHTQKCERCKERISRQKAWILDSGASQHFTSTKVDFIDFEIIKNAPEVNTASAKAVLRVEGQGSILLSHFVENKGTRVVKTTRIYPVLYIPGLSVKLLSVGSFLHNKQEIHGNARCISFHDEMTLKPLLSAYPQNPMDTIFWVVPQEINVASNATIYKVDYDIWHKRLGHPSKDVLKRARDLKDFPNDLVFPEHSPICRGCAEGKLHSKSFPESNSRATTPFALVHSDLKEFPVESYGKYKYLVSFLDDFSSHAWVVFLRKKSQTFTAFKHFVAMVKTRFKATVGALMSDFGGEYKSKEFDTFLKENGIQSRNSVPHMHQQNGRAERFNRTLMDKAQAMRLDACFPPSWWEFAVHSATHLYNRTPVRRLKWRTPYELLFNEVPSIGHLRVFGCGAYVHIPAEVRKDKLAPRGELMIFLGYVDGVKGYLFMRLPNNVLFFGTTAIFDEEMMPKCSKVVKRRFTPIGDKVPSKEVTPVPTEADDDGDDFLPHRRSPSPVKRDNAADDDDLSQHSPPRTPPRQQEQLPPAQRQPPPPPRRSGRERRMPVRPDNVYGDKRNPVDLHREDRRRALGKERNQDLRQEIPDAPQGDQQMVPGPSSPNTRDRYHDAPQDTESQLAKLAQEGGVDLINYLLAKAVADDGSLPNTSSPREWTFRDILRMPKELQKEWKKACYEELESLRQRHVFELTELPPGRKAIKNRWVFDIKSDGRKKARLVAKGFSQVEGIDYDEVFSPVVRFETVRIMFALAALSGWQISGLDVKTAFLYGKLDEEIYMEQPEGFKIQGQERKVLRLRRAIYGLKQAALAWWRELANSLKKMGFKRLYSDAGIFICRHSDGTFAIIVAYVDDVLFVGPSQSFIQSKKKLFMTKWECRDLGDCKEFLRMRVIRKGQSIYIDQCSYLEKVIERFGMTNAKYARTPLPTGYMPTPNEGEVNPQLRTQFQQIIGSLLYIMLGTRPDIAFAVTKLAQFAANPSKEHLDKAKYVLRYLAGTAKYALVYKGASNKGLIAYTDSDYAADPVKRRSTTGYIFKLADGIISWQSRAQKTIALSATEAEYMALSDCSRQAVWIQNIFTELGLQTRPTQICADNEGGIFIASNPVQERRTKHIDVRFHYVRDLIEQKRIDVVWVPTDDNPADMFTKNLGHIKFEKFRGMLGLEFYSS